MLIRGTGYIRGNDFRLSLFGIWALVLAMYRRQQGFDQVPQDRGKVLEDSLAPESISYFIASSVVGSVIRPRRCAPVGSPIVEELRY